MAVPEYQSIPIAVGARKQIGHSKIFRIVRGRQDCYDYVVPSNPRSAEQQWWRGVCALAVGLWQALTGGEKEEWDEYARRADGFSGYHCFVSAYLRQYAGLL